MRTNNNIVVSLDKVTFAEFNYICHSLGRTYKRKTKPIQPTVNGHEFDCEAKRPLVMSRVAYSGTGTEIEYDETMLQYATRRGLLDIWHSECILTLTANQSLTYTGKKAISIWKAWCSKQYNKK